MPPDPKDAPFPLKQLIIIGMCKTDTVMSL